MENPNVQERLEKLMIQMPNGVKDVSAAYVIDRLTDEELKEELEVFVTELVAEGRI